MIRQSGRVERTDVHPDRVRKSELASPGGRAGGSYRANHLVVRALGGGGIGVAAGELRGALRLENFVQAGAPECRAGPNDVGLRAEHNDVEQVVQPVDRVRHEERVARVQVAYGIGRHSRVNKVRMLAVAGHLRGETNPALLRTESGGQSDARAVEVGEGGLDAQDLGGHAP